MKFSHPVYGIPVEFEPQTEYRKNTDALELREENTIVTTSKCGQFIIFEHYRYEKELLLKFQELFPDKILMPGLCQYDRFLVANFLPITQEYLVKKYQLQTWSLSQIARHLNFCADINEVLTSYYNDFSQTISNAIAFKQFASEHPNEYNREFWFDDISSENFRADLNWQIYWIDPIYGTD